MQVADALSEETRIKSGVPQGSMVELLFLLVVNDLISVTSVTTQLFAADDDVKMVSPRSQSDILQGSPYNVWNW